MKKDEVHTTWFAMVFAIVPILVMTLGRTAFSWSQNHLNETDYLLYSALSGILAIFLIRSFSHPKKDEPLFRLLWNVRNRHMNNGSFFFGVNSPVEWVASAHIYATALAILAANVNMMWYYDKGIYLNASIFGAAVGIFGFLFAYLTPLLTVAEGEMIAALPIIIWIFGTTKID